MNCLIIVTILLIFASKPVSATSYITQAFGFQIYDVHYDADIPYNLLTVDKFDSAKGGLTGIKLSIDTNEITTGLAITNSSPGTIAMGSLAGQSVLTFSSPTQDLYRRVVDYSLPPSDLGPGYNRRWGGTSSFATSIDLPGPAWNDFIGNEHDQFSLFVGFTDPILPSRFNYSDTSDHLSAESIGYAVGSLNIIYEYNPIPEPSTGLMCVVGALVMLAISRRLKPS